MALTVRQLTSANVSDVVSALSDAGSFDTSLRWAGDIGLALPPFELLRDALTSPERVVILCVDTVLVKVVGIIVLQTPDLRVLWQICDSTGANGAARAARFISISSAMLSVVRTQAIAQGILNPFGRSNPWGASENAVVLNAMVASGKCQNVTHPTYPNIAIEYTG